MLALPTTGVSRSVSRDNVKLDALCDWIEGSVLFCQSEISKIDVVDVLLEEPIFESQDEANRKVDNAWSEIRRRLSCIGNGAPISVSGAWIEPTANWRDATGYCFCLALSFAMWYPGWAEQFGSDYTEQGALFEELTCASMSAQLSDWQFHQTGWSRSKTSGLSEIVSDVASLLRERPGDTLRWTKAAAKDAGLDLLCYRPFPDNRVGIPVFLMQCASGRNWESKVNTPDLKIWKRVVQFVAEPKRAFSTPYAFLDDEFIRIANRVDGLLIDRCRLMCVPEPEESWVSADLADKLVSWLEPRVTVLPGMNE